MKWVKRKRTRNRALRKASFSLSLFFDTITEAQLAKAVSNVAGTLTFITGQINQPMRFFFHADERRHQKETCHEDQLGQ